MEFDRKPAKPSLFGFSGTVKVVGPFAHPDVQAQGLPLLARLGASVGLALVAPPAALLPLIDVGGKTGAGCRKLVRRMQGTIDDIASSGSSESGGSAAQHAGRARKPDG